ncbi:AMP-dependent synthetase, partial [Streptomyces wedmorensis]
CDGVRDAVTVPRPAAHGNELVVFYTGREVDEAVLADGVRAVLPHSVLPRRYVRLEQFPLNPNRKVDRLALRKLAENMTI